MKNDELTGVFDSGVGGLSILKELIPYGGHYLYFGDTKNLPYGNKTKDEIINFTRDIIKFFINKGAKKVIMACNTSSALAYETLNLEFGHKIKIYPLIQTVAPYIAKESDVIGVMATEGTVKSQTYTKEIKKVNSDIKVYELACPDFVKIVENGLYNEKESIDYIKEHLDILLHKGCKKIVLGCTHYPYLLPILTKWADEKTFINPALYMTNLVKNNFYNGSSKVEFFVSSSPEKFRKNASIFMEIKEGVELVENKICKV